MKYLEPEYYLVKNDPRYNSLIRILERDWIKRTNPKWLLRYDESNSFCSKMKNLVVTNMLYKIIKKKIQSKY